MKRRVRMAGRRLRVAILGVGAALLTVGLAGCPEEHPAVAKPTEDCSIRYLLEVANDADDRVRVRMRVMNTSFSPPGTFESDYIVLESGAKQIFIMSLGLVGCEERTWNNNESISSFTEIRFYDENSTEPYLSYTYPTSRCGDATCSTSTHRSSDGNWENLFVESPDRPFYLELDEEDPYLARIVITFAPNLEQMSAREVSATDGRSLRDWRFGADGNE